jgi:hypothetical protein
VLELRSNELCCRFRRVIAADPCLRVMLKPFQHDGFRCRKGRIPTATVLHRFDCLSVYTLILIRSSLPDQVFAGFQMLSLAEVCKISGGNCFLRSLIVQRAGPAIRC